MRTKHTVLTFPTHPFHLRYTPPTYTSKSDPMSPNREGASAAKGTDMGHRHAEENRRARSAILPNTLMRSAQMI